MDRNISTIVQGRARHVITCLDAVNFGHHDMLGFTMGGMAVPLNPPGLSGGSGHEYRHSWIWDHLWRGSHKAIHPSQSSVFILTDLPIYLGLPVKKAPMRFSSIERDHQAVHAPTGIAIHERNASTNGETYSTIRVCKVLKCLERYKYHVATLPNTMRFIQSSRIEHPPSFPHVEAAFPLPSRIFCA